MNWFSLVKEYLISRGYEKFEVYGNREHNESVDNTVYVCANLDESEKKYLKENIFPIMYSVKFEKPKSAYSIYQYDHGKENSQSFGDVPHEIQ